VVRRLVGIAGAPGAGKSTYAEGLVAASPVPAAYLPMDGFHLADVALTALGLLDRKGAPETFDAWGYAALLRRVRESDDRGHTIWAPGFARDLEQPLAGAIAVPPEAPLVVTEGNYLLLDRPEWRAVRAELDEVWFLDCPDGVRRPRLIARHVAFGKSARQAAEWVARVDDANATLILASRSRADRFVTA
jgi:pantothenate kinase